MSLPGEVRHCPALTCTLVLRLLTIAPALSVFAQSLVRGQG